MKKILLAIAGLFLLLVIAIIVVPFLIPTEAYKDELVRLVKERTGRELTISGPISVSLFPNIQLEVENLTLGNPEGFSTPHFITLQRALLDVPLKSLMKKKLEILHLHLVQPDMNLEQLAGGKNNWTLVESSSDQQPAEQEKKQEAKSQLPLLAREVTMERGTVRYLKSGGNQVVIEDIALAARMEGADKPLFIKSSLQVNTMPLRMHLEISRLQSLLEKRATTVALEILPGEENSIRYSGVFSAAPQFSVDGKVELSVASLAECLKALDVQAHMPDLPVAISGTLHGTGKRYQLAQAQYRIGEEIFSGDLQCDGTRRVMKCQSSIAGDRLDLRPFFPEKPEGTANTSGAAVAKADSSSRSKKQSAERLPLAMKLQAVLEEIVLPRLTVKEFSAITEWKEDILDVKVEQMQLLEGHGTALLELNRQQPVPAFRGTVALNGVDIQQLLALYSDKQWLEGKGNMTIAFVAAGKDKEAILRSLRGNGSVEVAQGAIHGANLVDVVRKFRGVPTGEVDAGEGKTDFGVLASDVAMESGVLTIENLAMQSPLLHLAGKGNANLLQEVLELRLSSTLFKPKMQDGKEVFQEVVSIPLKVTGSFGALKVRPDLTAKKEKIKKSLQKRLDALLADPGSAKGQVQDLKDKFKQEKGKLKDLLKKF